MGATRPDYSGLTFEAFSAINLERCKRWHPDFPDDAWTVADWSNAMMGEVGETAEAVEHLADTLYRLAALLAARAGAAANTAKKIRRNELDLQQASGETFEVLRARLANEIGDVFPYADLLAQAVGLNTAECVANKFNAISVREGFPERIYPEETA